MSVTTMSFEELQAKLMPVLHEVLALRLVHNRTWDNVEVSTTKRYMDIKWCSPKKGDGSSQTKRVQPFNADTLTKEIATQFNRLKADSK